MIFFKSLPELKANSQACSGTKTQTFLQSCFESTKAAPILKAAPGAEAKSWLSHFSHPQLLENSVTFCLWQLGRISAEGRPTGGCSTAGREAESSASGEMQVWDTEGLGTYHVFHCSNNWGPQKS